jgi:hypothetical protein
MATKLERRAVSMASIYITLDETMFDVSYGCPGVMRCKFALCQEMPVVNSDDECTYHKNGSCYSADAQIAAIESVRRRLAEKTKVLKSRE